MNVVETLFSFSATSQGLATGALAILTVALVRRAGRGTRRRTD